MAQVSTPTPLLEVAIDPDFEPQKRPRSCTWPLPKPESNAGKPESNDTDIIPEEEDDEEEQHATSMAINVNGTRLGADDQSSNSPTTGGQLSGQENGSSPLSSHSPTLTPGGLGTDGPGTQTTPRKSSSRRNAWGNLSYADLITKAIESTPDKRLTLSQIYDWMVRCVPYFKDKGDSNSSAGWKNSIRHNLSLHSRFIRAQNEGTGKSSWWMINPEGGKGGKAPRRRAVSMDNSSKYTKSARGRAAKKKAALQAAAGEGGGDSPSGLSKRPGSPTSRSSEELDAWTDFRSRTNSNASTLSGRLSPIMANAELDEVLDEVPDDEPPLSPMQYSSPGRALSPGNPLTPNGKPSPAELPRLADLAGTMNLNDGLTDDLMAELLDNFPLPPTPTVPAAQRLPTGINFGNMPAGLGTSSLAASPSVVAPSNSAGNGAYSNSIFGPLPSTSSLRPSPMQTIQENKQTSFSSISRFGGQTLQDLLNSEGHSHSDVMMTQSDPLMSQASAAAVISQNSRRGLMLRSDPMMTFGITTGGQGGQGGLLHYNQNQSSLRTLTNGGLSLSNEANVKQQLRQSPLGLGPNGSSMMQIDSSLFLNGSVSAGGGICSPSPDRFPSDLDVDMFNGSLECDMDSIIRNELMDAEGLDFNFDSLANLNGATLGSYTSTKQNSQSWVPS
ncbi:hypothetical protein DPEC_G00090500 [Dallia pectoralis]|uniref:Uncharacterized protein n=1 Tax=Dallia pectoralis TaxID=75939 RepID=A0ACC2H0W7_DALPE|nr:hypothetical protein DPEC_G00090500 [Dallia pectoralis]